MSKRIGARAAAGAAGLVLGLSASGSAQLDPLLFLKSNKPRVVLALDVSSRMQRDSGGRYYDPVVFERTGQPYEATLGVDSASVVRFYRRRYVQLSWSGGPPPLRGTARAIETVGDRDSRFATFDDLTVLGRVRSALRQVIEGNARSVQFGLVLSRQASPRIDTSGGNTVAVSTAGPSDATDTGTSGQWRAGIPLVDGPGALGPANGPLVSADAAAGNAELLRLLAVRPGTPGGLLPAGSDTADALDAPLGLLLDDVRAEAARLIAADTRCCNTVVVLIAGGGDPSLGVDAFGSRGEAFLSVNGRRVPIHVVALAPRQGEAAQLREVATRSGGRYVEISAGMMESAAGGQPVEEISAAIAAAVQHGFATPGDFNTPPSPEAPIGRLSLFPTAPPVVGTVNLESAVDAAGRPLPGTRVTGPGGQVLPQRSNVMFTTGFQMPGFSGRLGAFRVYRPVADDRQATGYRFSADGAQLWTASVPPPDQRNVYTVLPGGGLIAFRVGSAEVLRPFLGVPDPAALIDAIRLLPPGAMVNSTPALLEPPSMPFADAEYAAFAAAHGNRRSLVFVGADDGMMHAFDARTGLEVWAVVPFNLLPKLRRLRAGLFIDDYPYMVDASPRLADVKVGSAWRTFLCFGEGPGGTFYQAFDVTLDGIGDRVPPDSDNRASLLEWFSDPARIPFRWSYPRYGQFDPSLGRDGDLRGTATEAEKSVGQTWSTPLVGRAGGPGAPFVLVVGSGPLPRSREREAQRGGTRAGTRLYMLDAASGTVADSRDVGNDGVAEDQDDCVAARCDRLKNALQADPVGPVSSQDGVFTHTYLGDLDGRMWRFDLASGPGPPAFAGPPRLLLETGADQPIFGSVALLLGSAGQTYFFLATGSDLLPRTGVTGAYRLLGAAESAGGLSVQFDRALRTAGSDGVDEAVAGAPAVSGSVAFFVTASQRPAGGCEPAEASLYALTIAGGVAYDASGDRRRSRADRPVVTSLRFGRATAPVVADGHVLFASGDRLQVLGDPERFGSLPVFLGIRVVSWREVR